ncbi:Aste57867_303 [Aphanomyces stellatus]|uniref:Aste57867_303 protein n=1 Tax=Aphanomyces stellatus TaxID=120398 RepID=A0A485K4S3_9STRA|nr:hypothetical protein As57867_000303 [Aphanomyces stellatus]VFT77529.1 Aste57867_303 [Aphanomyces stellatus]
MHFRNSFSILDEHRRTIVLLANYRDSNRCAETLNSLFSQAARPDLLSVSIFDQVYPHERRCMDVYCANVGESTCRRAQVVRRTDMLDAAAATGPTLARHETERGIDLNIDTFALSIDSHLVFTSHWDMELKRQWDGLANPRAILTTYPKSTEHQFNVAKIFTDWIGLGKFTRFCIFVFWGVDLMGLSSSGTTSVMCYARIETDDADAMVQFSATAEMFFIWTPRRIAQFAGGFNFGTAAAALAVRNDPLTPFLFHGEEYSKAARLFTHGYDTYAPTVDIVYHWYESRPVIWERDWPERYVVSQRSKRRVRAMLGLPTSSNDWDPTNVSQFGLGKVRSFDAFVAFSGIDPRGPKLEPENSQQFDSCKYHRHGP